MPRRVISILSFALLLVAGGGVVWIVVEGVRADPGLVGALATTGITVSAGSRLPAGSLEYSVEKMPNAYSERRSPRSTTN